MVSSYIIICATQPDSAANGATTPAATNASQPTTSKIVNANYTNKIQIAKNQPTTPA